MSSLMKVGFLLLALTACSSDNNQQMPDLGPDMSAVVMSCTDLCARYATCYTMEHPEFLGDAKAQCEATCGGISDSARATFSACFPEDCFIYVACGTTAGILPQQPDMAMPAAHD
jgi:hypothetical protein